MKLNAWGGWKSVFRDGFPHFAHVLRNYFNQEPLALTRLDASYSHNMLALIELNKKNFNTWDTGAAKFALSEYVYKDQVGKVWFQMSPGATIYHWGGKPKWAFGEAVNQNIKGQEAIPIFKLVSPDGTGGSQETIIKNPQKTVNKMGLKAKAGQAVIGEVNKYVMVSHLTVSDPRYEGSYNFAETVVVGNSSHANYDVETHEKSDFYLNPGERFSPLSIRRFPNVGNAVLGAGVGTGLI